MKKILGDTISLLSGAAVAVVGIFLISLYLDHEVWGTSYKRIAWLLSGQIIATVSLLLAWKYFWITRVPAPIIIKGRKYWCTHPDINDWVTVEDPFVGPWVCVEYKDTNYLAYPNELYL